MNKHPLKMLTLAASFGFRSFFSSFSPATIRPPHKMIPVQHSSDRQFARYVSQGLHNTPDGRIERKKGCNNAYSSEE